MYKVIKILLLVILFMMNSVIYAQNNSQKTIKIIEIYNDEAVIHLRNINLENVQIINGKENSNIKKIVYGNGLEVIRISLSGNYKIKYKETTVEFLKDNGIIVNNIHFYIDKGLKKFLIEQDEKIEYGITLFYPIGM